MVSCPSCAHRCGVRHAMIVGDRLRYQCPRCIATFDVADVLSAPSLQRGESTPIASFGPPLATGGDVFDDEVTAEVARGIQEGDSVYFVVGEADKAIEAVFPSSPELPHVSRYSFIRPGALDAAAPQSEDEDDVIEVVPVSDQGDEDAIEVAPMSQELDSDEIELIPSSGEVGSAIVSSGSAERSTARGLKISEAIEALAANSREMVDSTELLAVESYEPASVGVLDMGIEAGSNLLAPPTLRAFMAPRVETAKTEKFTIEESVPPVAKTPVPAAPAKTAPASQRNMSVRGAAVTGGAMLLAAAATLIAVRSQSSTSEVPQLAARAAPAVVATTSFAPSAFDVASKSARSEGRPEKSEIRTYASPSLLPAARAAVRVARSAPAAAAARAPVAEVAPAPVVSEEPPPAAALAAADVVPSAEVAPAAAPSLDDAISQVVVKDSPTRKRGLAAPRSEAPPVRKNAPPPTDAEVVTTNADRAYGSGDLARASALYREALALSPRFIPARLGAAAVEWDSGDREAAKALYRALVADAPSVVPAIARERAR